jgi:hypothetical protein
MRKLVQKSVAVLATSLVIVVGCGDDDDDSSPSNTGGASSGGARSGGASSTGGSAAKGGSGGANSGGRSGGTSSGGMNAGGAGGSSDSTECEVIGELCHEVDDGDGPLHDCHQVGHVGDTAVCRQRFASCVTACVDAAEEGEGSGGAGGATSVGGAGGSGGAGDGQSPYCIALGELCHPVAKLSAALEECHEVGHIGDAAVCAMRFDGCATACLAAREEGEGGGNGGAGGMSAGGAGGMSAGGGGAGGNG